MYNLQWSRANLTPQKVGAFCEDDAMFLILLLLVDGKEPDMYVIPASAWRRKSPVFVSHDYPEKKSRPDYTVNVSKKNLPELEKYRVENMLSLF